MGGLTSGFDVARAGWEFPEGICAGITGYPSDLVSEWLDTQQATADNITINTLHNNKEELVVPLPQQRNVNNKNINNNPADDVSNSTISVKSVTEADLAQPGCPEKAVKISFSAAGLGGVRTKWEAVLWQDRLYVSVTQGHLSDGSKKAFVSLLEYAEEELGVEHVIACLDKEHHHNKNVIRNFLFLGFQPLTPGHEYFPTNPNLVCFLYTI